MAVLQMQKLCICALKKDRKSLMEFLQAAGVLELTAEAEPDEVFKRTDTLAVVFGSEFIAAPIAANRCE